LDYENISLLGINTGMDDLKKAAALNRIADEYGLSITSTGILISIYSLSYALFQTPFGYLSRLMGRKKVLVLGFIITSVSFLMLGFINNLSLFIILLFIAGIGGSAYHPNGMPLLSEFFQENRGQASGFHQSGGAIGSFIGPLVIGSLVYFLNWRLTMVALSTPGIVLLIILRFFIVEPSRHNVLTRGEPQINRSKESKVKTYIQSVIVITAAVIYTTGIRGIDSFATLYFMKGRGITNFIEASFLFSTLKIAGLFSGPLSGRLSDMFGRKKVLVILACIESLAIISLTLIPNTLLIIPCIIFGFSSFGLLAITDAFLADITPEQYMSAIFGLYFTLSFLSQAVIPTFLGFIVDHFNSFNLSLTILGSIVPLSVPILLTVKNEKLK